MNKSQIIILLGRSGSGKGTQAKLLIKEFGFDYLGSGDLLRKRVKQNDFSGQKLKQEMNRGDRVSTYYVFQLWGDAVEELKRKPNLKGVIVDGSPRSLLEADLMDGLLDWYEWKNVKVILIDVSQKEAFDRLTKRRICTKCGQIIPWTNEFKDLRVCNLCGGELEERADDTSQAIKRRMEYFRKDVEPVIEYYQKQKKLVKIDGEQSIEDVYRDVKRAIK